MNLGDRVKDKITGTKGIVVGYHYWLYGCERITVQPEEAKDGKPVDTISLDAAQVEVIKAGVVQGYTPPAGVVDSRNVIARPAGPRQEASRGHQAGR
jgi:hypothetical protein